MAGILPGYVREHWSNRLFGVKKTNELTRLNPKSTSYLVVPCVGEWGLDPVAESTTRMAAVHSVASLKVVRLLGIALAAPPGQSNLGFGDLLSPLLSLLLLSLGHALVHVEYRTQSGSLVRRRRAGVRLRIGLFS